jgi:HCOMODA/2-hydroxy-3-carboxy-muconic semialdehyde decarboxylase
VGKSIREAVYTAYYLEVNASLQLEASRLGDITYLTAGEIAKVNARLAKSKPGEGFDRFWEYWCGRTGMKFKPSA